MGCCDGTWGTEDERRQILSDQQQQSSSSSLNAPVTIQTQNVINRPSEKVYYVIIGRGPMAIVNHRTLVGCEAGRTRIDGKPVVHVGFPNPWPKYIRHGLGQPNHLLSFPGVYHQPSEGGKSIDGGLDSQHFGRQFEEEFKLLKCQVIPAWVALIQSKDEAGEIDSRIAEKEIDGGAVSDEIAKHFKDEWDADLAPYRLFLIAVEGNEVAQAGWLYASKIDICTGPGRPQVLSQDKSDAIRLARTPPWLTPETWIKEKPWGSRRTMNGVDAIRDEVEWQGGGQERVCITGGGGVGLNAAEKSRNSEAFLDWFARAGFLKEPVIFANPRNITYLKHPKTTKACDPGPLSEVGIDQYDQQNEDKLIAAYERHRMGRGAELKAVNEAGNVEVWLTGKGVIRDWWGNPSDLDDNEGWWKVSKQFNQTFGVVPSRIYTRLVIPNGQGTSEVGQPSSFAKKLAFDSVVDNKGRRVALATKDGLVRILGAACNDTPGEAYPQRGSLVGAPKKMWDYHATLPVSAVPDGFIICGANTARANGYFDEFPNTNINTATPEDLIALGIDENLALSIIEKRNANNGYLDHNDLGRFGFADMSLKDLTFAYPSVK